MPTEDKPIVDRALGVESSTRPTSKRSLAKLLGAIDTLRKAQDNDKRSSKALCDINKRLLLQLQKPEEFEILWEGLFDFYDSIPKLINQQKVAKKISSSALPLGEAGFLCFCEKFWYKVAHVWNSLGSLSLDKYYYLMRCIEFTQYSALEREKWDINFVERIVDMMQRLILNVSTNSSIPDGLKYHVVSSFLTELSKVANKDANPISFDALNKLVGQFFYVFEKSQNLYIQREICKNVFAEFPLYDINCADTEHIKRIRDRISSMLSGELYKTSAKKRTLVLNALKTFDANVAKKKKQ